MKTSKYHTMLGVALAGVMLTSIVSCEKPPTTASQQTGLQAAENVENSDMELASHIKSALLLDEMTSSGQIMVVVTKGDALLTGEVATQQQLDQALKVAKSVEGVHTIHNELSVKASASNTSGAE